MSLTLFQKLTPAEQRALSTFAATAGANWRALLIDCWANGEHPDNHALHHLRERIGGAMALWKIKTSDLTPVSVLDAANDRIQRAQAGVAAAQAELRAAIDAKIELLQEQVR